MKRGGRYDISGLVEAQSEPGSRGTVLKNLLGIKKKREIDQTEARELKRAEDTLFRIYDEAHQFTAQDICKIHKTWLGEIYEWAGKYRKVNLGKGTFPFAYALQIPQLMEELDRGPLRRNTPCRFDSRERIIEALAEVHTELVLIHPFREGNGRTARILATLMTLQAGLPLLDFSAIRGVQKQKYFRAVQAGLDKNYKPMEEIFSLVIRKTLKKIS